MLAPLQPLQPMQDFEQLYNQEKRVFIEALPTRQYAPAVILDLSPEALMMLQGTVIEG